MGEGRDDDVRALLDPAKAADAAAAAEAAKHASEHQDHQVSLRDQAEEDRDLLNQDWHRGVLQDEDDAGPLWTDYPPPEGFAGREVGSYG